MFRDDVTVAITVAVALGEYSVRVILSDRVREFVHCVDEDAVNVTFVELDIDAVTKAEFDTVFRRVSSLVSVSDSLSVTVCWPGEMLLENVEEGRSEPVSVGEIAVRDLVFVPVESSVVVLEIVTVDVL